MGHSKTFACWLSIACALGCSGALNDVHNGQVLVHDVGPVFVDAEPASSREVRHDFLFRNPSANHAMQLDVERQSCACGEEVTFERYVPPGETATVTLAFQLGLRQENRRLSVLLATGVPELPKVVLSLAAEGFPRLALSPDRVPHLRVPPGQTKQFRIAAIAYRPECEPSRPLEAVVSGEGLSLLAVNDVEEVVVSNGVRRDRATFLFAVQIPATEEEMSFQDAYTGVIDFRHAQGQVTRTVWWSPQYAVRAVPDRLFLRAGAQPTPVRLTAEEPFRISRIQADNSAVKCSYVDDYPASEHVIEVGVTARADQPATSTSALRVAIDHPERPSLTIPVSILW